MNILAVDDEPAALSCLVSAIKAAEPDAMLHDYQSPAQALAAVKETAAEVAFLDIQMGGIDGITLAKKMKQQNPRINIIFVTGFGEYRADAFDLFASGYLMKPVEAAEISRQLDNLRFPVKRKLHGIRAKTFGSFELLIEGEPLHFPRSEAKEVLACLIDGQRAFKKDELGQLLFGSAYESRKKDSLTKNLQEMKRTLKEAGAEKLLVWHWNHYEVNPECFTCDLYEYRKGYPAAINAFQGEYLLGYAWAEKTRAELLGDACEEKTGTELSGCEVDA